MGQQFISLAPMVEGPEFRFCHSPQANHDYLKL